MKTLFFYLLLFAASVAMAGPVQPQKLLTPKLDKPVPAVGGDIELPAFCVDATRIWPKTNGGLKYVYLGGKTSVITLSVNGKKKKHTVEEALAANMILISPGNKAIYIRPVKGYKLISIQCNGLVTGEQPDSLSFGEDIFKVLKSKNDLYYREVVEEENIFDEPPKLTLVINNYDSLSKVVWKWVHGPEMAYTAWKRKRVQEYLVNKLQPKIYLDLSMEKSNASSRILMNDFRGLNDIPNGGCLTADAVKKITSDPDMKDLNICIEIGKEDTTITFSGEFKGVIPIEVAFSSYNKLKTEVELINIPAKGPMEVGLEISYADNKKKDSCETKISGTICFPKVTESSIEIEVCGKSVSVGLKEITFGF